MRIEDIQKNHAKVQVLQSCTIYTCYSFTEEYQASVILKYFLDKLLLLKDEC